MRSFILIGLLLAVGGFILWFATSLSEQKVDFTHPLDTEMGTTDPDIQQKLATAAIEPVRQDREKFLQGAETRFQVLDRSLNELQAKAKNGRVIIKDKMNQVIGELAKKTEAARTQLGEFKNATAEPWHVLKERFSTTLDELEEAYEKAASQFMNENAMLTTSLRETITRRSSTTTTITTGSWTGRICAISSRTPESVTG